MALTVFNNRTVLQSTVTQLDRPTNCHSGGLQERQVGHMMITCTYLVEWNGELVAI